MKTRAMPLFSFAVSFKLEWLAVANIPVWKRRPFVTISVDGIWASLVDLPNVRITAALSVINGKPLRRTKSLSEVSLVRPKGGMLTIDELVMEAYEDHPAIYRDLEASVDGVVFATFVTNGVAVKESYYTLSKGVLTRESREVVDG